MNDKPQLSRRGPRSRGRDHVRVPDLYMPAMPPLELIRAVRRAWRRYRGLRRLRELDDRLLQDIGFSRNGFRGAIAPHRDRLCMAAASGSSARRGRGRGSSR